MYVLLHFLPSAYGRYASRAFGVLIPARIAWFLQDLPAVVIPLLVFFNMEHTQLHLANYIVSSVLRYSTAELTVLHSLYDGKCLTLNLHFFLRTWYSFWRCSSSAMLSVPLYTRCLSKEESLFRQCRFSVL